MNACFGQRVGLILPRNPKTIRKLKTQNSTTMKPINKETLADWADRNRGLIAIYCIGFAVVLLQLRSMM